VGKTARPGRVDRSRAKGLRGFEPRAQHVPHHIASCGAVALGAFVERGVQFWVQAETCPRSSAGRSDADARQSRSHRVQALVDEWFLRSRQIAERTSVRSLTSMVDDVARNGTIRPNRGERPGTIFEQDLGQTIGMNGAGKATSRLRVVVAPDGTVVPAFPY